MKIEIEISRAHFWFRFGSRHLYWHREDGLMVGRD